MPDLEKLQENLKKRGYAVSYFETAQAAADYLDSAIDGTTVSFGGSVTLDQMGMYDRLKRHNTVKWHWKGDSQRDAMGSAVYLTSMNGVSESGEMVSIDGNGNRVAGTIYGSDRVYIVIGVNKIAPDLEQAIWRARNIAAPKNAIRMKDHYRTPCAVKGDRCYDCSAPDRMCRVMALFWGPLKHAKYEVILINQELGY